MIVKVYHFQKRAFLLTVRIDAIVALVKQKQLECGPIPNLMVALRNTGGALCSTPQSLADAHYWSACSNAAKTRNPLKFAGVPQTNETISATSGPKFAIL